MCKEREVWRSGDLWAGMMFIMNWCGLSEPLHMIDLRDDRGYFFMRISVLH